jgi:polysaccharide export outer membrane protein
VRTEPGLGKRCVFFAEVPKQKIRCGQGELVKAKWAVAWAVPFLGVLFVLGNGCSGTKSQVKEFNRMDVGEGPGEVMTHLIQLQKEQEEQQAVAQPPPAAQGKTSGSGLATPGESRPRQNIQPTVTPMGDPHGNKTLPKKTIGRTERASLPPLPEMNYPSVTRAPEPPAVSQEIPLPSSHSPSAAPENTKTNAAGYTAGPEYRIGPEDVISINVWGTPELTRDATVRPDGKISLPLIQDIQAEGLTSTELSERIRGKLLPFLKDPTVSVIVKEINASKFFIIGYVARPGTYPLRGDITVLQAISLGGGFTPFASPKKLRLVRNVKGKQDVRVINYYDIIERGGEGNYLLKPGDTLVVP